jgi:hypothetical protein
MLRLSAASAGVEAHDQRLHRSAIWVHANEFELSFTVLRPELCPDVCPDQQKSAS